MALSTTWIYTVVTRVVALRVMAEDAGCPAVGRMTYVTLHGRAQVSYWFGCRTGGSIVAAVAVAGTGSIMGPGTAEEGRGGMALMTIQGSRYMRRVNLGILADRCATVMT